MTTPVKLFSLVGLILAGTLCSGALAADTEEAISESPWTMFMGGPTHSGAILGPLADIRTDLEWSTQVGYDHTSYSSQPVAAMGNVYVAIGGYVGVPGVGAEEYAVLALDAGTGEIQWVRTLPKGVTELAASTDRYSVFAGCRDGFLYALDMGTGTVDWKQEIGPSIWSAPTIADDDLYIGSADGALYRIRVADGSTVWATYLGRGSATSPVVVGDAVYVTTTNGEALRLTVWNGAIVWRTRLAGDCIASPSFSEGILFCGTAEGESSGRGRLTALCGATGGVLWEIDVAGEVLATPTVRDGIVYFSGNEPQAVSAADGSTVWTSSMDTRGRPFVIADDGVVAVSPARGEVVVLDRDSGQLLYSFCPGEFAGDAPQVPLFLDFSVVITCADGYVRCFDLTSTTITITNFSVTCVPLASVQTAPSAASSDQAAPGTLPRVVLQAILLLAHALIFGVAMHWIGRLR